MTSNSIPTTIMRAFITASSGQIRGVSRTPRTLVFGSFALDVRDERLWRGEEAPVHRRGYRFIAPVTTVGQSMRPPDLDDARHQTPTLRNTSHATFRAPMVVGREAEFDQLQQCFAEALQGERQVVFVTGEAGIGKTTVVDIFVAQLSVDDSPWIGHGQCIEQYGDGEAYLPLLEAMGRLCRGPYACS